MTEDTANQEATPHLNPELMSHQNPHITVQADGTITGVNDEVVRITQLPPEQFIGHTIMEFMPEANQIDRQELFTDTIGAIRARKHKKPGQLDPTVKVALPSVDEEGHVTKHQFRIASKLQRYRKLPDDKHSTTEFVVSLTPITDLSEMASMDELTMIPNRREFFALAARIAERDRLEGKPVTAVILDIDSFKNVNDTYGHKFGDRVLQIVARRAKTHVRPSDVIGRYGGEEFALVLSDVDTAMALRVCERIRHAIAADHIVVGDTSINKTASIGISLIDPDIETPIDVALAQADEAMYALKQNLKNGLGVYVHEKDVEPYIVTFQPEELPESRDYQQTTVTIFSPDKDIDGKIKPKVQHVYIIHTFLDGTINIFERISDNATTETPSHEVHIIDSATRDTLVNQAFERIGTNIHWIAVYLLSPYSPHNPNRDTSDKYD